MSKRPKIETDTTPLTSNPFAALAGAQAEVAEGPAPEAERSEKKVDAPIDLGRRLVVRRQKKGQGGKTVTCIEGLDGLAIASLLPRLKRELGCSGRADGDVLIAGTGDHARVAQWLRDAGASKVVLGN